MTNISFSVERTNIYLADVTRYEHSILRRPLLILFEGMDLFIPEQERKWDHSVHIYYSR